MLFSLALLVCSLPMSSATSAGVARWVANQAKWGTLTTPAPAGVAHQPNKTTELWAGIVPIASSDEHQGRLFFYLMNEQVVNEAALTISQASFESTLFSIAGCGNLDSAVDAQDPRCAKLTVSGMIQPCSKSNLGPEECDAIGREALFATHPAMEHWPQDHHFNIHEMLVDSMWMISSFGGASLIHPEDYANTKAEMHQIDGGKKVKPSPVPDTDKVIPEWSDLAARSRWIVRHSRWGTVSTRLGDGNSNEDTTVSNGHFFGNIRSVTDGVDCEGSTGRPIFYFPNADRSAQDMLSSNGAVAISFSEASLAQRVSETGEICGGLDAGSPMCGQVVLYGKAVPIESTDRLKKVLSDFGKSHPLAPWLATGGSHMQGTYYTIEIEKIMLLDYFGGYKKVNVGNYLQYEFASHTDFCHDIERPVELEPVNKNHELLRVLGNAFAFVAGALATLFWLTKCRSIGSSKNYEMVG